MSHPRIAVASLGGTITMTSTRSDGAGVRPTLTAYDLLAAVPGLADIAELTPATLITAPGASLTFTDVLAGLEWAREQVRHGAVGAVLIQGTDTIEETAYLLDLYWDSPAPLVVTGAMRAPQSAGADGPANLLAAVQVASADASRDRGVLVVLNDTVHAAERVRKTQASGPDAFASASFGPLGYLDERQVLYGSAPGSRRALVRPTPFAMPAVALIEAVLGDSGEMLRAVGAASFDGVVLAGFGVGHVPSSTVETIEALAHTMPVVLASRTGSRGTHRASYGFSGSESDLIARGVIPSGWLDARKARILLACLLAARTPKAEIRAEFDDRARPA
ncbi:MAG: hypothetical protein K0R68_2506 [Mycobacterium sp.]|nr:hypothetical protein [Mycobacterium sp.]